MDYHRNCPKHGTFIGDECLGCTQERVRAAVRAGRPTNPPGPAATGATGGRGATRPATNRRATNRYPRLGDRVHVVGFWNGKSVDLTGTVDVTARRVRSGAVMGRLIQDDGRPRWFPWSTDVVEFQEVVS